jgi:enediyne biosynthesis protein E4
VGDGRAFAQMDWDHDGDMDLVVVNANAPRVQLFENQVGAASGQALWLDLRGSGDEKAGSDASNRDGIGARVVLRTANGPQSAEKRAGEGFASQNTGWLHFGLGSLPAGDGLMVYWPSGRESKVDEPLQAGARYRIYEDLSDSPTRSNLERVP